jgi:hypothetical protein
LDVEVRDAAAVNQDSTLETKRGGHQLTHTHTHTHTKHKSHLLNIVEALDETDNGALAGARGADKRNRVARASREADPLENRVVGCGRVRELDVLELDVAAQSGGALACNKKTSEDKTKRVSKDW